MYIISNWILDTFSLESDQVKLRFKKMRYQFPLHSRWQILEFYKDLNDFDFKNLKSGEEYSLLFNSDLICVGAYPRELD